MSVKDTLKNTFLFKKIFVPIANSRRRKIYNRQIELFKEEGLSLLTQFVECMASADIVYWLEFGTLLGAYRDGKFIPNDFDIDVGVWLKDAKRINKVLVQNGFRLVREFHVVGENGLEQTYEYHGITIDIMYFYESDHLYWCNGATFPKQKNKIVKVQVTAHWFKPFGIAKMTFLGLEVPIPDNVEEHLIEIFGEGFRIYDPNFPGDLNKKRYPLEEKWGMGFVFY